MTKEAGYLGLLQGAKLLLASYKLAITLVNLIYIHVWSWDKSFLLF